MSHAADGSANGDRKTPPAEAAGQDRNPARARERSDQPLFAIVGIGASAGGLEALELFVARIPADSGLAYVVVTHQAAGRPTLLSDLLARRSAIPVVAATHALQIRPNTLYVAPPGQFVSVKDSTLFLAAVDSGLERHLPIDHLFRSLARNDGNSIGIVLSGTGSDGALGVSEIKGASGMVMAQDPDTAKYAGMPRSAIATQSVDYVLSPEKMPEQLLQYVRGRHLQALSHVSAEQAPEIDSFSRILILLRSRTGNDFSGYKRSTVRRRVARRMAVHEIPNISRYVLFLEKNAFEVDALFQELLISVTSFFRDAEAFSALAGELRRLIETREDEDPIRVWVPGCSTGEEAYSIAIVIKELLRETGRTPHVQIFATDLDSPAIDAARIGRYPEGIAADVSPERLARFFIKDDSFYRIAKEIRDMLVFACQNVIKDAPFTKLDLVSCRNLLIYLEPDLQKRALGLFSYGIRPGGLLLLGTSENIGGFDDRFATLDKKWKLYRRQETALDALPDFPVDLPRSASHGKPRLTSPGTPRAPTGVALIAERVLLSHYVPPGAIVSEAGDVVYLHGRTGPFLEPAPGEPTHNIFQMAREGLRVDLLSAIHQASKKKGPVRRNLQVKTNGGFSPMTLTAQKLTEPEGLRGMLLVGFELDSGADGAKLPEKPGRADKKHQSRIESLELELQRTRENLQGTIEELETSNEELKSTNEELQSTNEELQSANEELETSREEMQSLNEELQTVNAEFEERNRDLTQANDDMQNLLNSTGIATIFLDNNLSIKRFTRQAKKVFSLIDSDVGRPLSDLTANLRFEGVVDDAKEVSRTLVIQEREIQTRDGSWRLMRIMPYRTHENIIDGLVMTFVDIDRVKQAENESRDARTYAESIVDSMRDALLVVDEGLIMQTGNRAFHELFGTGANHIEGKSATELPGVGDEPAFTAGVRAILRSDEPMPPTAIDVELPGLRSGRVQIRGRRMPARSDGTIRALLTFTRSAD